jgi:hypothetical protein
LKPNNAQSADFDFYILYGRLGNGNEQELRDFHLATLALF